MKGIQTIRGIHICIPEHLSLLVPDAIRHDGLSQAMCLMGTVRICTDWRLL